MFLVHGYMYLSTVHIEILVPRHRTRSYRAFGQSGFASTKSSDQSVLICLGTLVNGFRIKHLYQ